MRGSRKERWISDTTWKAIDECKQTKQQELQGKLSAGKLAELKSQYKVKDKEVNRCCTNYKQQWYNLKASEAEPATSRGDHKALYKTVKELIGQRPQSQLSDGRFARTHEELLNRWKDHFQAVLNCPEPTTTLITDDTDSSMELPINVI